MDHPAPVLTTTPPPPFVTSAAPQPQPGDPAETRFFFPPAPVDVTDPDEDKGDRESNDGSVVLRSTSSSSSLSSSASLCDETDSVTTVPDTAAPLPLPPPPLFQFLQSRSDSGPRPRPPSQDSSGFPLRKWETLFLCAHDPCVAAISHCSRAAPKRRFWQIRGEHASTRDEELTVLNGDVLELLSQREQCADGWWTMLRCSTVGLVPAFLCSPLSDAESALLVKTVVASTASCPDELSFAEGELIEVVSRHSDTFWSGRLRQHIGLFRRTAAVMAVIAVPAAAAAAAAAAADGAPSRANTPPAAGSFPAGASLSSSLRSTSSVASSAPSAAASPMAEALAAALTSTAEPTHGHEPADVLLRSRQSSTPSSRNSLSLADTPVVPPISPWELPFAELKLGDCIGRGGFSSVIRATWRGRTVAVKRLTYTEDDSVADVLARLTQEASLFAGLSHRNIVQFVGTCSVKPDFALVMEYVADGPLQRHLSETLSPAIIVNWAEQVATGMNYLHDEAPHAIIHRDLKSSNVLVSKEKVLKITDFGLARQHEHTTRMSTAGTWGFMAPEVIRSNLFSKGADVWSYGVVLWEMLTAKTPYEGVEGMAVAYGVATNRLSLPIPTSCPEPFRFLLQQCWQPDPHLRPNFRGIIRSLQQPATLPFSATPRHSFIPMQEVWHREIDAQLAEIRLQEQELIGREEELRQLAVKQTAREEALDARERELRARETELINRERLLALEAPAIAAVPAPEKNKERRASGAGLFLSRRKSKGQEMQIGKPYGFLHVAHLGPVSAAKLSLSETDPDTALAKLTLSDSDVRQWRILFGLQDPVSSAGEAGVGDASVDAEPPIQPPPGFGSAARAGAFAGSPPRPVLPVPLPQSRVAGLPPAATSPAAWPGSSTLESAEPPAPATWKRGHARSSSDALVTTRSSSTRAWSPDPRSLTLQPGKPAAKAPSPKLSFAKGKASPAPATSPSTVASTPDSVSTPASFGSAADSPSTSARRSSLFGRLWSRSSSFKKKGSKSTTPAPSVTSPPPPPPAPPPPAPPPMIVLQPPPRPPPPTAAATHGLIAKGIDVDAAIVIPPPAPFRQLPLLSRAEVDGAKLGRSRSRSF